jgi:hypothetical protein
MVYGYHQETRIRQLYPEISLNEPSALKSNYSNQRFEIKSTYRGVGASSENWANLSALYRTK